MTIRYKAGDPNGVPSGYGNPDIPSDYSVPGCGIEDVDKALFSLFEKQLKLTVHDSKTGAVKKAPVIFASGERYALFQKNKPIRDNNQTIILPLVVIRRTGLEQNVADDITGRGINQQTGELVIKRRLSSNDRAYQNLVNKLGIPNQVDVAQSDTDEGSLGTDRKIKSHEFDLTTIEGGYLNPILDSNVWEIITIPSPQFYSATYEITFWTQYTIHMNQMIQQLMAAYLPQGGTALKIETAQGYWFIAKVANNQYNSEDNSEDYGEEERLIKYTFNIVVPAAFIPGSNTLGIQAATRRYISAPVVDFSIGSSDSSELSVTGIPSSNLSIDTADDPTSEEFLLNNPDKVPLFQPTAKKIQSTYTSKLVYNPFTRKNQTKYARIVTTNTATGETVYQDVDNMIIKIVEE